jgi:hypothetical protein
MGIVALCQIFAAQLLTCASSYPSQRKYRLFCNAKY